MWNMLIFLIVLSLLVLVHELGHFLVARRVGVRVERFSIGFGPILLRRKNRDTEFCVSLLPLGGYVKLAGESVTDSKGEPWEYCRKSVGARFMIIVAGPLMNAFLAFVLFAVIAFIGQPTPTTLIGKVLPKLPAAEAGIVPGDRVLQVNGVAVTYWEEMLKQIEKSSGTIHLLVKRADASLSVAIEPKTQMIPGKAKKLPFLGIGASNEAVFIRYGFFKAIGIGAERLWKLTELFFVSLWLMCTGTIPVKESMTGPIGIYFMTSSAAAQGLVYLLYFMGSLSVSLFVLNLLPIPVLDGGHLLFLLIEKIKGSALSEKWKDRMTQVGLVLLVALMVFVVVQDVSRIQIFRNLLKSTAT